MSITKRKVLSFMLLLMLIIQSGCASISTSKVANKTSISNDELQKVFSEYSPKLDGAYAEGYASKLIQTYEKSNLTQFIEVLSTNNVGIMEGIIKLYVGEMLSYNKESMIELEKSSEKMKGQPNLNRKKKYALYEILAQILYFKEALNFKE